MFPSVSKTLLLTLLLIFNASRVFAEIKPDFLMDSDPLVKIIPVVMDANVDFSGAWMNALERPEIDFQRMAAGSIAKGYEKGIPNMKATIPALEKVVTAESSHLVARFAAAKALIVLDSRGSSDKLFDVSQRYGSDLRCLIEPVLAEWDHIPSRRVWISRLNEPTKRPRELQLAIRSIGRVGETSALPQLLKITLDLTRRAEIRIDAATAAGQLVDKGLESDADRLTRETRSSQIVNRLCAVRLLARHKQESVLRLLTELASDNEPTVAARGLECLNQIDPALVLPLAEQAIVNADMKVREQAAISYLRLPTTARMDALSTLLNDPHPGLRRHVCEGLAGLAQREELGTTIRDSAMDILAGGQWRGQEQASLLLGQLEYQPASKRLVELLESQRPEVLVAAAWGLRKVADPLTIPAICDKIRRQTEVRKLESQKAGLDFQVGHLFEACGKMRALEARPLMLAHIPKQHSVTERSRSAAIWSLGWLQEGKPDESIASALMERITDPNVSPPAESVMVKEISVVAMGRMKATSYAPELFRMATADRFGQLIRWTVKELTGEIMPEPESTPTGPGEWFLEPLERTSSSDVTH